MGYTNKTTHYELPQYVATDKPKYLTDFNETMAAIDTQMYTNAQAAATADGKAVAAKDVADGAVSSIGTLNTQINGDPTDPSDTGLSGQVSGIDTDLNTVESLIGSGSPTTSNQTIIGAINSMEASIAPAEDSATLGANYATGAQFARGGKLYTALVDLTAGTAFTALVLNTDYKESDPVVKQLEDLDGDVQTVATKVDELNNKWIAVSFNADRAHVTADGIKTYAQLITELYSAMTAYIAGLADDRAVEFTSYSIDGVGSFKSLINAVYVNSANYFTFSGNTIGNDPGTQSFNHAQLNFGNGYSQYTSFKADSNGNSFTDLSSNVPTNGVNIYAIGTVYKKL